MKQLLNIAPASILVQIAKYGAVGILVNGSGYGLFLAMLQTGMGHKLSATISYFLGVLASFWLNRSIVFGSTLSIKSGLIRLGVMLSAGYILNIAILYVGVDILEYAASILQFFSIIFVSLFFYSVNKFYVHRNN